MDWTVDWTMDCKMDSNAHAHKCLVCPYCVVLWGSLNSLDLRNGGVALYLENFNRLELLGSVP